MIKISFVCDSFNILVNVSDQIHTYRVSRCSYIYVSNLNKFKLMKNSLDRNERKLLLFISHNCFCRNDYYYFFIIAKYLEFRYIQNSESISIQTLEYKIPTICLFKFCANWWLVLWPEIQWWQLILKIFQNARISKSQ